MTEPDAARSRPPDAADEIDKFAADSDDLDASLFDLAVLVNASMSLDQLLTLVATYAANAIPGADGAGVTLLRLDREDNIVQALAASVEFVSVIDDLQYNVTNEGPCITAARERVTVRSGNVSSDSRWPRFGPRVGRLGVHSALSLPLLLPGEDVVGAINAYSRARDVFDDHAVELGELFATPAAVSVHNAHVLGEAQTRARQLQAALTTRPVIDQAIGILRARSGGSADEAFSRLRAISQRENVKLIVVAQHIVDEAVRRAHARHVDPSP